MRGDEPGRVLWPETSATDGTEGMKKVGLWGWLSPACGSPLVLRGLGGEHWWGRRALLLLLVVVGNTGRG
jgi:hypothetical protein